MSRDSFNRTLDFNTKFKYFIAAWALIELVLIDAVYKFINILNNQKIIHLPKDFDPSTIYWSEDLPLNLLKIIIVCIFAFIFGVTYSYLARKVLEKDKASISVANSIAAVFGTYILLVLILALIQLFTQNDYQIHDSFVSTITAIRESTLYTFVLLAQLIGAGIFSFIGLTYGQSKVEHIDEEGKGRLLGIKWYHYLWLWFGVSIYLQALLWLCYWTVHTIALFIHQFRVSDVVGTAVEGQDSHNSISTLLGGLFVVYIIAVIIFYLLSYQRDILSGEKKVNILLKVGTSILVAFIIPVLLVMYTAIGASDVR